MRHVYECPLRWGDMDMLGHVNNVTWVDYLQEARIDMFAVHAGFTGVADLADGVIVARHEVDFVAPLVFRQAPVQIEVWITEIRPASFTMAYEVYDELAGERTVYLRASSVLAPYVFTGDHPRRLTAIEREVLARFLEPATGREPLSTQGDPRHVCPVKVRFSDLDVYRHVNNVQYFAFFQEARIQYVIAMHRPGEVWGSHAIARMDVGYRRPVLFRTEPYEVHSWISRLGGRSFTISAELRDPLAGPGADLLATAQVVMVSFDAESQRSAPMTPDQHRRLAEELPSGAGSQR